MKLPVELDIDLEIQELLKENNISTVEKRLVCLSREEKYLKVLLALAESDFQLVRNLAVKSVMEIPVNEFWDFGISGNEIFLKSMELLNSSWSISRLKGQCLMEILTRKYRMDSILKWNLKSLPLTASSNLPLKINLDLQLENLKLQQESSISLTERLEWFFYFKHCLETQVEKLKLGYGWVLDGYPIHGVLLVFVNLFVIF